MSINKQKICHDFLEFPILVYGLYESKEQKTGHTSLFVDTWRQKKMNKQKLNIVACFVEINVYSD